MVLAGPGSGKTSVIVERTAYMINEGKIPASSILVVTFFQSSGNRDERTVFEIRGTEQKRSDFWNFPRNFLWDFESAYHLSAANILS